MSKWPAPRSGRSAGHCYGSTPATAATFLSPPFDLRLRRLSFQFYFYFCQLFLFLYSLLFISLPFPLALPITLPPHSTNNSTRPNQVIATQVDGLGSGEGSVRIRLGFGASLVEGFFVDQAWGRERVQCASGLGSVRTQISVGEDATLHSLRGGLGLLGFVWGGFSAGLAWVRRSPGTYSLLLSPDQKSCASGWGRER